MKDRDLQLKLNQCSSIKEMLEEIGNQYDLERRLLVFEKITIAGFLSKVPRMLKLKKR